MGDLHPTKIRDSASGGTINIETDFIDINPAFAFDEIGIVAVPERNGEKWRAIHILRKDLPELINELLKYTRINMQPVTNDVDFMAMNIPIDEIKTDGYQKKIIHQPIRQALVDEIKKSFTGLGEKKPIVVYSCEDGLYHVIKNQHWVEAIKQLVKEGKIEPIREITCDIISRKSTCEVLDANVTEDRLLCFEYSYTINDVVN